jgi:cytochrome c oxidase subunit II
MRTTFVELVPDGVGANVTIPLLLTAQTTHDLSIFDPASPSAESIRSLYVLVFAITGFIFIAVEGILFYSIFRFRRQAKAGTMEPPQVYGSKPIEIAWTAAPALVVFVLVLVTARTLWEVNVPPPQPREGDNTLFVTVVGRQWWWEYTYENYNGRELGFTTANELHVPASEPGESGVKRRIFLKLKSADVCHSYWVPRLAGKTDLIPGRVNSMWFQPDTPGLYVGQCAEYCGTQHAHMLLRVVVDTPEDFETWLTDQAKEQKMPSSDDVPARAFFSQSCVKCHRVRGTSAQGSYGPDLTHLMSRQTLASGMVPNTPENLDAWVKDPQQIKPGCLMPDFGLSEAERNDIVRYLRTLR